MLPAATTLSTDSTDDDPTTLAHDPDEPWLFRVLSRAAAFADVLKSSAKDERDANVVDLLGRDIASLADRRSAPHKLASLGASSWLRRPFSKGPGLAGSDTSDEDDESEPVTVVKPASPTAPAHPAPPTPPLTPPTPIADLDIPRLTPEEQVALIISEFGSLGDNERLLAETDAAFFQEVVILGVVHLTTHRLTFHASLLDARPDLVPARQVRHAGAAVVHSKGLCRRKRVWLELTDDMVTSFRSSDERARVRPLRTILLSAFRRIYPVDPAHPRIIRLAFAADEEDALEFDTPEAALAWRRELHAALFLARRSPNRPARDTGVRISVPLASITAHSVCAWPGFGTVLRLALGGDAPAVPCPVACTQGLLSRGWTAPLEAEQAPAPAKLQFALLRAEPVLDQLSALVQARHSDSTGAGAVVDFGALTFVEHGLDDVVHDENGSRTREVRRVFGLGPDLDIWITKATLTRTLATSGLLVVSARFVCFWSRLIAAADIKLRFPAHDVRVHAAGTTGLTLHIRAQPDMHFNFPTPAARAAALRHFATAERPPSPPAPPPSPPHSVTQLLAPLTRSLATLATHTFPTPLLPHLATPINVPSGTPFGAAPAHFVCLTIGSRGDVQPYIALARGLQTHGHRVTIVTHPEYQAWVEGWGVGWRGVGGDPGRLMKLSVEHKMFSPQFFRESIGNFRTWIDELLADAWAQCQDADVIIESPPAMAGVHIAEALGIPYFRAFTMPWSKTAQYPHALMSPPVENSAGFNLASYVLFDNVFWRGTSGQINRWRKKRLGLDAADMGHLAQARIPFLYNFSPSVVPKPMDWGDQITVTGYWFLDDPDTGWTPPASLLAFISRARADGKPLVYIGFGSITVPRAHTVARSIIKAVLRADVRAVLVRGWSDRMGDEEEGDVELPPEVYGIDKVPHDWLFPQMDAALHHGGAGTTGASLRAGIPTLIKPWFGDQFFWASRVHKLGAGLRVPSLRSSDLADALHRAMADRGMREKAAQVGEQIAQEDGVPTAIKAIYTYLHRARLDRTTLEK